MALDIRLTARQPDLSIQQIHYWIFIKAVHQRFNQELLYPGSWLSSVAFMISCCMVSSYEFAIFPIVQFFQQKTKNREASILVILSSILGAGPLYLFYLIESPVRVDRAGGLNNEYCFRRPAPGAVLPVRVLPHEAVSAGQRGGREGGRRRVRLQQLRQAQETHLGAVRGAE